MYNKNFAKAKAIERSNKERLLKLNPDLNEESGIYFLTREEDGFKFAYIGQARHILTRLAQHLVGYQHIDLSLKKHKLYSKDNPSGWKVNYINYPIHQLDKMEQFWIKRYANEGYQLRNKTSGSQGEGKSQIDDYKPSKGYYDGVKQGKVSLARQLTDIINKHLIVTIREDKKNNKISQKAQAKFYELINEDTYKEND